MSISFASPGPACSTMAGLILTAPFLAGMASVAGPQAAAPAANAPQAADTLTTLNNASRMLYTQAKARALAKEGPVMIVVGDDLVMRQGQKRRQARVIPEIYHTLKTYAHVPMAIDVALAAHADENPLAEDTVHELRDYRAMLPAACAAIPAAGLDREQQERQKSMVEACTRFLDSVIEGRRCTAADRMAFARRMNPLVMANVSAAARAALDAMHRQVCEWRTELTSEEWRRLTVIVIGRPLPRKDNLAVQYFARLLDLPGEGKRLIYVEGQVEEARALDQLATDRVDTQIAVDFFNDRHRMARDLLADAARSYLPILIDHAP
jgi:hypothetical protein